MDVKITVDTERISGLLGSAFEGGSNYWYLITEEGPPTEVLFRTAISDEDKASKEIVYRHIDYPLNPGGYLMIGDKEDEESEAKRLDLDAIKKGLQVMADKFPAHYGDFLAQNDDAVTGDVFLQCCLFGDVIYG